MKQRRSKTLRQTTGALSIAIGLTLPWTSGNARADDWWDNTPYYEEDGWLDVTEWFDGNDYNPTDEAAFRIDDETYDGSEDVASDSDSDWDDNYYTTYDGWNDYPYTYGYNDTYADDDWFYDYWDEGYSTYVDSDGDGNYESSSTWYDFDGDGYYDAHYTYYDTDDDGVYDSTNANQFQPVSDSNQQQAKNDRPDNARSKKVKGNVANTKKVLVRDTKHLVVEIKPESGKRCFVDLGPADELGGKEIGEGQTLQARGPEVKVGDKKVIVAQQMTLNGKSTQIDRKRETLSGEVADTKRMKVRGKEHLIAILATGQDKKTMVNLGEAQSLKVKPSQGNRLRVTGVPVKVGDRRILMANKGSVRGNEFEVTRSMPRSSERGSNRGDDARENANDTARNATESDRMGTEVAGKVTRQGTQTVRGHKRRTVTVLSEKGTPVRVDLGAQKENTQSEIEEGNRLEARGILVKSKNGQPVLLARSYRVSENKDSERMEERNSLRRRSRGGEITGEIVATRQETVRDQRRQVVRIETDGGDTYEVDLGSPQQLDEPLKEGDTISVRGPAVKSGNRIVVVAEEIDHNGSGSTTIRRNAP